jgi:hypothetical protein
MAPVWATAHVTQFSSIGWRYLKVDSGSGLLRHGGYFTTTVDPNSTAFSLHVVKNSFDHAPCTRPGLPASLKGVSAETVTFKLSDPAVLGGSAAKLACWRSNFELETPILFEQQPDIVVTAAGTLTLTVSVGDYFTVSTVRTASHGSFVDAVPASEPQFPLPYRNNFDDEVLSQQPRLFSQMVGAFEVAVDSQNASNQVVRQTAPQQPTTKAGAWVAGVYKPGNGFSWCVHPAAVTIADSVAFPPGWPDRWLTASRGVDAQGARKPYRDEGVGRYIHICAVQTARSHGRGVPRDSHWLGLQQWSRPLHRRLRQLDTH